MAKSRKRNPAITYARRLTEDDYVQAQLRQAATGLRQAYERAARRRGKAAEDKKLYAHLRESATSIRRGGLGLQRTPPDPRRRGGKRALGGWAGGGAAVAIRGRRRSQIGGRVPPAPDAQETRAPAGV